MVMTTREKRQDKIAKFLTHHIDKEPAEIIDNHRVLGVVIDNNLASITCKFFK